MASCGYHSPQFSEDVAWLPEWLHPHQLRVPSDGTKDEQTVSQLSCKNLDSLPKDSSGGKASQLFTEDVVKYSGCRLHLSGDTNSLAASIPSSEETLHFHLHLSSLGVSELSKNQLTEVPHHGNCETNEGSPKKHLNEVQDGAICWGKMKDNSHKSESPTRSKSRMSQKRTLPPPITAKRKLQRRPQQKPNAGNICNADINDAVELSIAASEAMTISDMFSSSLQPENLAAAEILEISLRLKQARKECSSDIFEADAASPADELSEAGLLSELDDNIMADAFEDVGISFTQILETGSLDNTDFSGVPLQSSPSDVQKVHITETNFGNKEEALGNKQMVHETDVNAPTLPKYGALATGSRFNYNTLDSFTVRKDKLSALVPLDCIKSCLKGQLKDGEQNLQRNTDVLLSVQIGEDKNTAIHKVGEVATLGNEILSKTGRVMNRETSFISESLDVIEESKAEQIAESESAIVASSSTPCTDVSGRLYKEKEKTIHEGRFLSQDLAKSSSLSLVDPLCSVVPCSISSDDAPVSCDPNQQMTKAEEEKFLEPTREVSLKEISQKNATANVKERFLKPLAEGATFLLNISVEAPAVPIRKQLRSLKNYSMVMPDPNTMDQTVLKNRPFAMLNRDTQFLHFNPTEENNMLSMSNKLEAQISLNPMERCTYLEASKRSPSPVPAVADKVKATPACGAVKDDDTWSLIHHHEERCSPIILNSKKRRFRACKRITNTDGEDESLKKSYESKIRKCKIVNSIDKDLANFTSEIHMQSSLRAQPANKQHKQNKRVHFLEDNSSMDRSSCRNNVKSKNRTHGSHHKSSRRVKGSNLLYKSASVKENYNYLTGHDIPGEKGMIFQGLEFLLTGFSSQKEKEIEELIRLHGGYVLLSIPSNYPNSRGKQLAGLAPKKLPIVLSPKKVQTTKYLYGCATNTWMLNAYWLVDSIHAGSLLPHEKYMTRPIQGSELNQQRIGESFCLSNHSYIFERMGIMLNGKINFCTKFSTIIKHGGGRTYKSFQRLLQSLKSGINTIGTVVVENESNVSRHLKHCALESNLQIMPVSWIVNSMYSGRLLPFKKDRCAPLHRIKMPTFPVVQDEIMSQEI